VSSRDSGRDGEGSEKGSFKTKVYVYKKIFNKKGRVKNRTRQNMAVKSDRLLRCSPVDDVVAQVGELERFLVNRLVEAVGIHEVVVHVLASHSSRQHVGHLKASGRRSNVGSENFLP
jgi:hypothetical protein